MILDKFTFFICTYNTNDLTNIALRSIEKFSPKSNVTVLDNGNNLKFELDGKYSIDIKILDNTNNNIINYPKILNSFCNKLSFLASMNNFATLKHSIAIEWFLWYYNECTSDDIVLLDSDACLNHKFELDVNGEITIAPIMGETTLFVYRTVPIIQYINRKVMRKNGIHFTDTNRILGGIGCNDRYDTGASFFEDIRNKNLGYRIINDLDYIYHCGSLSWIGLTDINNKVFNRPDKQKFMEKCMKRINGLCTALVCIAKNEDNYLKEWVDYHLKLGFDDIFVYQNNWRYTKNDIHDVRVHFLNMDGHRMLNAAYNHFIDNNYDKYDFVACFDTDEFLVINRFNNVNEWLETKQDIEDIYVNWRLFGDNGIKDIYDDSYSVLRRFTRCDKYTHRLGKHITNLRMLKNNICYFNPHIVVKKGGNSFPKMYDVNGNYINGLPWNIDDKREYTDVELYHYRNKTYLECYTRKFKLDDAFHEASVCDFHTELSAFNKTFEEHNKNDVVNTQALNFMVPRWLVVIVGTNKIIKENYIYDTKFNRDNYVFFNVSDKPIQSDFINVINSSELNGYVRLGYSYAESEVIYNIDKLGLFREYDYIGIVHYDFEFKSNKFNTTNITTNINRILDAGYDYISFLNMNLEYVYKKANILLDERDRNCVFPQFSVVPNPINCFDYILKHYNKIFGTSLTINSFDFSKDINMCCSFIMRRRMFDDLCKFVKSMIDDKYLEKFDDKKINRIPGNVIERAIGVFSTQHIHYNFDLNHHYSKSKECLKNNTFKSLVRY